MEGCNLRRTSRRAIYGSSRAQGVPQLLQGLEVGCAFLLIFDYGESSEYKAF